MVISMTGYGRAKAENEHLQIVIEIKTVNYRFCEYHIRMPRQLLFIEDKIKKKANEYIQRGRAEIFITIEGEALVSKKLKLDWDLADQFFALMEQAKTKYDIISEASLHDLLQVDDIFSIEEIPSENEELVDLLFKALTNALDNLKEMRIQEGQKLANDLKRQLQIFKDVAKQVKEIAPMVVSAYKDRLSQRISELTGGEFLDESRLVTETAIFADKCDINEELTRLESHWILFSETLDLKEPIGRKLDFLVQEMNREVNTIGSKGNDSLITAKVVEMKSLLEKMKEQVQNIE